jgi:iron complex outermembrane receptor protein
VAKGKACRSASGWERLATGGVALSILAAATPAWAAARNGVDLASLSLEDLGNVEIISVSKRPEPLSQAASSVYVITRDEILRSGARTVEEALRLAPNLTVAQTASNRYEITARGFNGNPATQSFSDKLLVLIDGRSVYTPIFGGVYWDAQDVFLQDVERIEVISGPGATLWGANAVNGVIDIITRTSADTQGGDVEMGDGNRQRVVGARYGGALSDAVTYRIYGDLRSDANTVAASARASADDHADRRQAGFRVDWQASGADAVTFQGDAYRGYDAQPNAPDESVTGEDVLGRWTRSWRGGSLQVQGYFDHAARGAEVDGVALAVDTVDVDIQSTIDLGPRDAFVWGGGFRSSRYRIRDTASLMFDPPHRVLNLGDVFAQDTVALSDTLRLTVGAKIEDDPYLKPAIMPDIRLAFTPTGAATLWAAISKAVRSPTPLDRDVVEILGGAPFLVGGRWFQSEKVTAFELGGRVDTSSRSSLSLSAFYNDYGDLLSVELSPGWVLPLQWGNLLEGHTYGVEVWGDYRFAPWWRASASANYLEKRLRFEPGSSQLTGVAQAGDDPKYQGMLKSSMNLSPTITLDGVLRYVGALPDPALGAYMELGARLGWATGDHLELSLVGENLLHAQHLEYPQGAAIGRSVLADLRWRF